MSFGLSKVAAVTIFQVLQDAKHRMKTGYGVLGPAYGKIPPPTQETRKGNGH